MSRRGKRRSNAIRPKVIQLSSAYDVDLPRILCNCNGKDGTLLSTRNNMIYRSHRSINGGRVRRNTCRRKSRGTSERIPLQILHLLNNYTRNIRPRRNRRCSNHPSRSTKRTVFTRRTHVNESMEYVIINVSMFPTRCSGGRCSKGLRRCGRTIRSKTTFHAPCRRRTRRRSSGRNKSVCSSAVPKANNRNLQ